MFVKQGTFQFATGVLTQTVTTDFRPKAIVFWSVGATANNLQQANPNPSYGFWADCGQEGFRTRSRFYYRSAAIGSGINSHNDFIGTIGNYYGMIRSRSSAFVIDSVNASGFNITWTTPPPAGTIWHYQAIGGDEVRAYIGNQSLSIPGGAASGYAASIDTVPFRPNAVMAIASHGQVATTAGADVSIGFMDELGSQFAVSNNITVVNSGGAYGSSYTQYRNDSLVAGASTEMRLVGSLHLNGINLLGYEGAGNASARSLEVDFLFLGGVRSKAQLIQAPTTNITQSVNVGFKPRAALSLGWHLGLQTSGDTPNPPNSYYLGGSVMLGGVNLLTGDKGVQGLVYTHATNAANGMDRNDLFWAAHQTSYADMNANVFQRWIATTGVSGTNVQLTYAGSNTKAAYIGLFTLGDVTKTLEAFIGVQSAFNAFKLGNPVPLSSSIRAESDLQIQAFGTVGNMAPVSMGAISDMIVQRISVGHALSAMMGAASALYSVGLKLSHPLAATMAAVSTFYPVKPGNDAPFSGVTFSALSDMLPSRLKVDHNMVSFMGGSSRFLSRFDITIPSIKPTGPDDVPGAVNLHPNPSAELVGNLIGWFDEAGEQFTIQQSTEQAWDGNYSVKHITPSGTGRMIVARSFLGLNLSGYGPSETKRRVVGQLRLYAPADNTLRVFCRVEYTDGTLVVGDFTEYTVPVGGGWSTAIYAPSVELDPTKTLLYVEVVAQSATGAAFPFYADGAQLEEDFGNGGTYWTTGAYGGDIGYWTGVPNASMSIRQPIPLVIHGIGSGGEVTVKGEMFRATWDNQWVEDISDAVIDCTVTMDTSREVTWSMSANFTYEGYQRLTENVDWVVPVLTVTYPDGTVKRQQLGLYFLVPGAKTRGEYERSVQVSAFDPLWLLAKQGFTGAVRARNIGERMRVVRDILDGAVLTGGDDGRPPRYSGPQSGKGWKKMREWAGDQDKLALVNEILEGAAMYPLWTIRNGEIRWRKMGDSRLMNRKPVRQWAANLPRGVRVDPSIPRVAALKSEVVGAVKTSSQAMDNYDEILIVNDEPDTKKVRVRGRVRGRHKNRPRVVTGRRENKRVKKLHVPYVDDDATAAEIALALSDQLSNRTEGVELSVLPDPTPDYCRETVLLAIWDAYGEPVAVGQFEVLNVKWGFTPTTCLQSMKLAHVDDGDAEITVGVE